MFVIKAFCKGSFCHRGYEAVAYEVDETAGLVCYQPGKDENWPILSLKDYRQIVIENSAGRVVDRISSQEGPQLAENVTAA